MAAARLHDGRGILVHHLHVYLRRHARDAETVLDVEQALIVGFVDVAIVIAEREIVAQRLAGMALPAELLGPRQADFQSRRRIYRHAQRVVIGIALDARAIKITQQELHLPRPQPTQDRPARSIGAGALDPHLRHWPGIVGQGKGGYLSRAPPVIEITAIDANITDVGRQVAAFEHQLVMLAFQILGEQSDRKPRRYVGQVVTQRHLRLAFAAPHSVKAAHQRGTAGQVEIQRAVGARRGLAARARQNAVSGQPHTSRLAGQRCVAQIGEDGAPG